MRMTSRKKEILSFFEPANREWVSSEIGPPPLDVSGITYLLHPDADTRKKKSTAESVRRTLEGMVKDGLLERVDSHERRNGWTQDGSDIGVWCVVARYGLPGQCRVTHDTSGSENAIEGDYCVVSETEVGDAQQTLRETLHR
ncbi:hypothetical protein [Edwardsiella tarda]|uniref:hypothetical protein n=1 Tax=Edwardsiella tarda TaxID=636 RepID=UPI00351C2544